KIERDLIDYRQLEKDGFCTISNLSSGIINTDQVLDYMESYIIDNQLDVQALCYDPYAIHGVLAELERRGWQDELYEIRQGPQTLSNPISIHGVLAELERRGWQDELYEIRQGPQTLSNPISDFRLKTINGNIKHEKNPLLDIAVKNAIAKNV